MERDNIERLLEELAHSNDQLKETEARFQRMVAEIQDYAIISLDPRGKIENWNKGAELIKGYKPEEIIGKSFSVFYTKEDLESNLPETLLSKARMNGKVSHEGWRLRKDGSRFWGSVVITALHDSSNNVIGFSKITRDLTEKKTLEDSIRKGTAELQLKNEELERLNEQLRSFTYVASHDLKEPLRKIKTFISLIEESNFEKVRTTQLLNKINDSTSGMQQLIEDLLSLSEITNQTQELSPINLNDIIEKSKTDLELPITEKAATINSGSLPVISGMASQLEQLFTNILSNALKFSQAGVPPVVSIDCNVEDTGGGKLYHIRISDNGVGFETPDPNIIFEPFQRLHSKQKFKGTGIGLAIARKVVENHKGHISVESQINKGTTFHIYFPAKTT